MARRVTFPLAENYFPPVELTRRDEEQFQAWAHALVHETLDGFTKDQYMTREQRERKWKPLKQRNELTVYRRRSGTDEEGDEYRYLCTGTVAGTLDEVMLGRYADTTDAFRRMSAVYRDDLVDCVVLHTVAKRLAPPAHDPFFYCGFKWMTVKSPGKGLVKNRDVCWFEQSGLTRDHKGKEIGYHIAQSVDLAACPPFDESVCVRARLSACYLFRRNKSGGVKVFMRGKNNAGGKVLDWVADMKSAELWLRAERAASATQALVATEMVRAALPPSRAATHTMGSNNRCEVCAEKTAGMMVSQKECAVCRRVTCSRCVVKRRVLSSARDFLLDQRELFCKRCVRFFNEIRHRDPQSVAMACAAAAARAEPHGGGSFDRHGYSHCSSHSSDSSVSSMDRAMTTSQRSHASHSSHGSRGFVPPSPGSMKQLARQDSQRSVGSHDSAPVVLYPELAGARGKPSTASSAGSSRGRAPMQPHTKPPSKTISVRRIADSDASTVASSVHSSNAFRPNGYNTSHSSFASEHSYYTDSTSSAGDLYSMYHRDTTDSSPHQSFRQQSVGSSHVAYPPSHNQYQGQYQGQYGARLGSTDELSPPVAPPAPMAPAPSRTKSGYSTPEDMMQQMIRMNIMAEQARQMVKDNDKFTRKFNFY